MDLNKINWAWIKEVFANKHAAEDTVYPYIITRDTPGWGEIEEARGSGVSIKCFADTSDKMVIHPGHLNKNYPFNYYWGEGSWRNDSCWEMEKDCICGWNFCRHVAKKVNKANRGLLKFAEQVDKVPGLTCKIVFPSGNCKGYLSTSIFNMSERDTEWFKDCLECKPDIVLFVFGLTHEQLLFSKEQLENTIDIGVRV